MLVKRGTNIGNGNKSVITPGVAVPITNVSTPCFLVEIAANFSNVDVITVGSNTVVGAVTGRSGIPLNAGEVFIVTDVDNLNKLWIDAVSGGDGVTYVYFY